MIRDTMPMPRLQPISFFSMGRRGSASTLLSSARISGSDIVVFPWIRSLGLAGERRFDAMEEEPRNEQPDPDHKAEQAHEINCGEFADAILPELPEIGEDAN